MAVYVPIPGQFVPLIADIIVKWGAIDARVDLLRHVLAVQKVCKGVPNVGDRVKFRERLQHFVDCSDRYFAPCPTMKWVCRRLQSDLLKVMKDRNLVAHGRYGFAIKGQDVALTLTALDNDRFVTRKYSFSEFRQVVDSIDDGLLKLQILSADDIDQILGAIPNFLTERWRVRKSEEGTATELIRRVQKRALAKMQRQYEKADPVK